jgi:RNA polymerase sigma-70 factor (ECF subfamily)
MIQLLPDHYREALMLSEINGYTQQTVAAKQNLSLSGAKSRIQRGRTMMKDMLLDCCRFEFDPRGRIVDYEERDADCGCDEC